MKLEFNTKNVNDDENTIYLLDEPGSYLHTYAQQKLCKKLLNLSKGNKVLYCTHTHYLLDPDIIPLNTVHIASKTSAGEVSLHTCNDYPDKNRGVVSAFQPIQDALGIRPFNLIFHLKDFCW